MNWKNLFSKNRKKSKKRPTGRRAYNIAAAGRLFGDWKTPASSANAEIEGALLRSRNRARDLHRNSDHVRRLANLMKTNVVGHNGFMLKNKAMSDANTLDAVANLRIKQGWDQFSKLGVATRCGRYSMIDLYKQVIHSVVIDGEILIRFIPDNSVPFGLSLQLIEADYLDEKLNKKLSNGNTIKLGIEVDSYDRAVAYWLSKFHPGDNRRSSMNLSQYERVPASDLLHIFIAERPGQLRGITWIATGADRLRMLDKYEEAALVAARVGASTMGVIYNEDGDQWDGDDPESDDDGPTADGDVVFEAEAGMFKQLSGNKRLQSWDPKQPTANHGDFVRNILRGVSAGFNVSYENLSNDRENVNYSSIRQGEISDRDNYKILQVFMIEHVCEKIFSRWLYDSLFAGAIKLPLYKFDQYNVPTWRARGWLWVDPEKESKAAQRDIGNMIASAEDVAAQRGVDIYENISDNAEVNKIAEGEGLIIPAFNLVQDAEVKPSEKGN